MEVNCEIMPPFDRVLLSKKRYLAFFGGRGGGKTCQIALALVIRILAETRRDMHYCCLRETQDSLTDSSKSVILDAIKELGLEDKFHTSDSSFIIRCTANGCCFNFKGMGSRRDAIKFKSIHNVVVAWLDEAESIKREIWEVFTPSVRFPGSQIIVSFNPKRRTDLVFEEFILNPPSKDICEIYKINYTDNVYFTQNESLMIEKEDTMSRFPERFKHIWLGATSTGAGQILDPKYWNKYKNLKAAISMCTGMYITADTAYKTKTYNDYSVIQCWGYNAKQCYLLGQVRGKWVFPDLMNNIMQFTLEWCRMGNKVSPAHVYVEDKASGTSLVQTLWDQGFNYPIAWKPKDYQFPEDKVGRANEAAFMLSNGCFYIPDESIADWVKGFVSECSDFEADSEGFDDQVDTFTMAASVWRSMGGGAIV